MKPIKRDTLPFLISLGSAVVLITVRCDLADGVPDRVPLAGLGSPNGDVVCRLASDSVLAKFRGDDVFRWAHETGVLEVFDE